MAPILVATAPAQQQQQQQQVEGGPRPFQRTWDQKCPISDIMTTDVSPMLAWRKINPVIVPVTSPAPAPVGGSLLQAPQSPDLSAPGPSKIPGPSTMPEPSGTKATPGWPNQEACAAFEHASKQCTILDLGAETTCGFSLGSSCSSSSSLGCDSCSCGCPSHRTTSGRGSRQPDVEDEEGEREGKYGPNGKMLAEKTWKEHKRAETTAREGTVQDPKCGKCENGGYICVRKETGPCNICMRMSDVCSFTGQSNRKREVFRRGRMKVKSKKGATTVTDPPADPAIQQAKQKRGQEPSAQDGKDDDQLPDLPVSFGQQAGQPIVKDEVEGVGESGSHASGSSGLGLRSRTLSTSLPPVVRKRSDEVEEDAGEDSGPRAKRRRIAVNKTD
ncbi:uncharacterized protein BDZ83DRAFT_658246 [Colletotrichum acutatum]|uniref:Zn(2)-C6 fungal-type domain-containing protein n=1 Tax=Glomerella acutata TaxID=27357 RepID=A0AAD8U9G8_GLOAC|nr:uncharacterized protein BDZ83DRAFT_658246 [Colletotrichum acutatum]KAK1704528.1 hypothetical protein BDZ83DRAFT_658246 [Colletotrichum acutatum]